MKFQIPACFSIFEFVLTPFILIAIGSQFPLPVGAHRWLRRMTGGAMGESAVLSMIEILHDPGCMKPYLSTGTQLVQDFHHQENLVFFPKCFSSPTQQDQTPRQS